MRHSASIPLAHDFGQRSGTKALSGIASHNTRLTPIDIFDPDDDCDAVHWTEISTIVRSSAESLCWFKVKATEVDSTMHDCLLRDYRQTAADPGSRVTANSRPRRQITAHSVRVGCLPRMRRGMRGFNREESVPAIGTSIRITIVAITSRWL